MEHIVLAVDAMGGDDAPGVVLEGVEMALSADTELEIVLCGPDEVVTPFAASHERCRAQVCTEVIAMGEHPVSAVRHKTDSSLVVGNRLVKEGIAQGFFSAGSTGACLAAGTLIIGRVKGVARPAICAVLPSPLAPVVMCDVGANADCKPAYLVQFARMASIYTEKVMGVDNPTVHLLNIGEEDTKGSAFAQETFALLKEKVPNFAGNCEGNDLLAGKLNVVVTDGFTGNVALKTIEGTAGVLFAALKKSLASVDDQSALASVGEALVGLKASISPDTYGAAPILGVAGTTLVGHGSSNSTAIKNGIATTASTVRTDVTGMISDAIAADREA